MSIAVKRESKPGFPIKETLFRGGRASVDVDQLDMQPEGGRFGGGLMRGVSLISTGEALGHEMWIDQETVAQVKQLAAASKFGVKSRFTHPSLSADGTGRHLGRLQEFGEYDDDQRVLANLHFAQSAHKTPDGDLAEYVMMLAEEDPQAAGLSIVFEHDHESEMQFMLDNGAEFQGSYIDITNFQSPDPDNSHNYPHVRLKELRAADVVDEPAANPAGLFDRQDLARDVDALLSYAAGLTEQKPTVGAFDVDPDRASQFVSRWLSNHGLSLTSSKEPAPMAETQPAAPEQPATPTVTRESVLSELKKYTDRFGAEDGQKWFEQGKPYTEALEAFSEKQAERITELEASLKEAEDKLSSVELGEENPVETGPGDERKRITFAEFVRAKAN